MTTPYCDTFWGSHGCDLPPGHDGPHQCGLPGGTFGICSRAEGRAGEDGLVQFNYTDGSGWGEPTPGWKLFSNRGPDARARRSPGAE